MPFLPYQDDEENKKKQQGDVQNISGSSTSFNSQPPGSNQSNEGTKTSSGQYTNINQYINANQDQAQQMGSNLTSQVEQQAQRAKQDVQSLNAQVVNPTNVDPTAYLNDPFNANKTEYDKLKQTGGYEGPTDISEIKGIEKASQSVNNAADKVQAIGTESGIDSLLQEQYRRPNYARGERSLDNVLVRNNQQNVSDINDLQRKYSNINNLFDQSVTKVGNSISEAQGQALENKKKFTPAENAAFERMLNPIQGRIDDYNNSKGAMVSDTQDDIADDILNRTTLDRLGITPEELGVLYDMNLNNYLSPNLSTPTYDQIATDEERAKYAALAQLAGDEARKQITTDGFREMNPVNFDSDAFIRDRNARKQAINSEFVENRDRFTNELINDITRYEAQISGSSEMQAVARDLFNKMRASKTPEEFNSLRTQLQNEIRNRTGASEANIAGTGKVFENWQDVYGFNRRLKEGQ